MPPKYGAEVVGLVPGQTYRTDELLDIMPGTSAADAAYTLANAYGPGLPAFIAKTNAEASASAWRAPTSPHRTGCRTRPSSPPTPPRPTW